jgi:hypothetical protein
VPVALLGLNCYAALAALSVALLFLRNPNRWITTPVVLLATLAAGASLWFIGLQIFVIGDFCMFCLATDVCGLALGAIAAWSMFRSWRSAPRTYAAGSSSATLSALRGAIPATARPAPALAARSPAQASTSAASTPHSKSAVAARSVPLVGSVSSPAGVRSFVQPPSMPIAYGGALALLIVLIGGQIVFPAKTYELQQASLSSNFDLSANGGATTGEPTTDGGEAHTANRIPPDGDTAASKNDNSANSDPKTENGDTRADSTEPAKEPEATERAEPKQERKIKLLGGKLTLDVGDEPIIGSIDAPHIVVEMVSYDCSHCRKTSRLMKKALSRYGEQVALVVLILPLESKCNRLIVDPNASHIGACTTARTAIALARLKPRSFPKFHEFLMSGSEKEPPSTTSILSKAFGLVDREKLQAERDSKAVEKKVADYVDLFALLRKQNSKNKDFGLPIQILGDHIMSGSVEKADDLYKAWEEHLGVKPR